MGKVDGGTPGKVDGGTPGRIDGGTPITGGGGGGGGDLVYAPPAMSNPTIIHATTADTGWSLNNSTDYIIYLPTNAPMNHGIGIGGGRNVRVIGGEFYPTVGYDPINDTNSCLLTIESPIQSIFLEGIKFSSGSIVPVPYLTGANPDYPDMLAWRNSSNTSYDIYFQNILMGPVKYSGYVDSNHVDCIQQQCIHAHTGNVVVENCSFTTCDQALLLQALLAPNTFGRVCNQLHIRNFDVQTGSAPCAIGPQVYFANDQGSLPTNGGTIENFYITNNPYHTDNNGVPYPWWLGMIYPFPVDYNDQGVGKFAGWGLVVSGDKLSATLYPADNITGTIYGGRPPGGNYCTTAGLGYVSPWD